MSEFAEGMAVGQSIGNKDGGCYGYPMMPVMPAYGMGYGMGGYGMGGFGYGNDWWILLLLFCGWGNGGWGNNGNNGALNYELGKVATTNDVASGFSTSAIMSNQRDIQLSQQQGFSDVQQTLCQGFSGVNQTLMNGFHGVDNAICTLGYNMQGGFNQLSHQLSDCCCQTQRAIDGVNFNAERNACNIQNAIYNSTRDIIDSNRCGFDRIAGLLTQQEIDRLRSENQTLRFEKSQANQNAFFTANQDAQTAELLRRLGRDCPTAAYLVPNPNCCYDANVLFNQSRNGGYCQNSCCGQW